MGLTDAPVHGPFPLAITQRLTDQGGALPDPRALLALERYIHDLFTFRFSDGFYLAFGIAGILLCIMIIVGGECRRIKQQRHTTRHD